MEAQKKRDRKVNFSAEERSVLYEEYRMHKELLTANHSKAVTNKRKTEIWKFICQRVNSLGVANRTVDELKIKVGNMKANFRAQHRHRMQTGGGPPAPAIPHEDAMGDLFGKDSVDLHGIPVSGTETLHQPTAFAQVKGSTTEPLHYPTKLTQVKDLSASSAHAPTSSSFSTVSDTQTLHHPAFTQVKVSCSTEPLHNLSNFTPVKEYACGEIVADCSVIMESADMAKIDDMDSDLSQMLEGDEDGRGTKHPQALCFLPSADPPTVLASNAVFKKTSTPDTRNQKRKRPQCNEQDYMKTYFEAATKLVQEKRELLKRKAALVEKLSKKADLEIELLEQKKMNAN